MDGHEACSQEMHTTVCKAGMARDAAGEGGMGEWFAPISRGRYAELLEAESRLAAAEQRATHLAALEAAARDYVRAYRDWSMRAEEETGWRLRFEEALAASAAAAGLDQSDREYLRERHLRKQNYCAECGEPWPCLVLGLLDTLTAAEQGRDKAQALVKAYQVEQRRQAAILDPKIERWAALEAAARAYDAAAQALHDALQVAPDDLHADERRAFYHAGHAVRRAVAALDG